MTSSTWQFTEGDAITPELTAMRSLGGGSAFEAWLAFDEITYGAVVAKVVRPDRVGDERTLGNLLREARALDRARHPVVARGLRYVADGPRPHLVLEHVEGPSLSRLLRRHGRLSPQQYLPLAVDIASALHYFRHIDVVHLDIKPSNIIMGAPARLIDFSVARSSEEAAAITGQIGTDAYMAPEQADPGTATPGHASDVWGLGATLFHAVAGTPADSAHQTGPARQTGPAHQTGLPDDVPADVQKVIHAMLAPTPADRPLPHEVADALEPALAAIPAPTLNWKG